VRVTTTGTVGFKIFSVIIPTCNRNFELELCLQRLHPKSQSILASEYEVIVTDDGFDSTAESIVAEGYPWVRWTRGPMRGPAANRNHGARLAKGDWLVFTDDDCLPEPNWLEAYANRAVSGFEVLEGSTLPYGERTRVDQECPINQWGGLLWSCNFAVRKDVFTRLGGFDECFPAAAMEDVDFNVRICKAGVATSFVSNAIVFHPWRREKHGGFYRAKAASIAYFVSKHPEQRSKFGVRGQLVNSARFITKHLLRDMLKYRARGVFVRIVNHLLLGYFTLRAISTKSSEK
jgi:GT2 family glycosyltransferase